MWTKLAKMSVREAMIELVGKPGYGEQPRWFEKVANAANISKRTARALWRGEIQDHNHRAIVAVRRAAELAAARKETAALAAQFRATIGAYTIKAWNAHRSGAAMRSFIWRTAQTPNEPFPRAE